MRRTQRTPNAKLSDQDYKQGERLVLIQQLASRLGDLFRLMSLRRSTDATASLLTTRLIRRKISSHQSGSNLRENALIDFSHLTQFLKIRLISLETRVDPLLAIQTAMLRHVPP